MMTIPAAAHHFFRFGLHWANIAFNGFKQWPAPVSHSSFGHITTRTISHPQNMDDYDYQ